MVKSFVLIALLAATPAAAQNLGTLSSTDTSSPLTAWTTGFTPSMQASVAQIGAQGTPQGCRPVVVGVDGKPVEQAGASLVPAMACVKLPKPPLATTNNVTGQAKPEPALSEEQTLKSAKADQ